MTNEEALFYAGEFIYYVEKFKQGLNDNDIFAWNKEKNFMLTLRKAYESLGVNWKEVSDVVEAHDTWPFSTFIEQYNARACNMDPDEFEKHNAELEEAFQKVSEESLNDVQKKDEEKQQKLEQEKLYKEKVILDKRCPFCNSYATITKISKSYGRDGGCDNWYIKCENCPAEMEIPADNYYGRVWYTYEQAKDMWNRRVT